MSTSIEHDEYTAWRYQMLFAGFIRQISTSLSREWFNLHKTSSEFLCRNAMWVTDTSLPRETKISKIRVFTRIFDSFVCLGNDFRLFSYFSFIVNARCKWIVRQRRKGNWKSNDKNAGWSAMLRNVEHNMAGQWGGRVQAFVFFYQTRSVSLNNSFILSIIDIEIFIWDNL